MNVTIFKRLLVMLLASIACTSLYAQKEVIQVERDGVVVIQETKRYEDMPLSFKNKYTRQQFERMFGTEPAIDLIKKANARNEADRARHAALRGVDQAILNLERVLENDDLSGVFEFTPEQIESFESIKTQYETDKETIENDLMGEERKLALRLLARNRLKSMGEVMLPFQREELGKWRPAYVGLPKVLTETKLGEIVGVSDSQRNKIRKQSQQIADEIEEFINMKRKEAASLTRDVLTSSQKEKLLELIPSSELNKSNNVSLDELWRFHDYSQPDRPFKAGKPVAEEVNFWQTK